MNDFMTIDMTRMNEAAVRFEAPSPASAPDAADTALFDALLENPTDRSLSPRANIGENVFQDGRTPMLHGEEGGTARTPFQTTAPEGYHVGTPENMTDKGLPPRANIGENVGQDGRTPMLHGEEGGTTRGSGQENRMPNGRPDHAEKMPETEGREAASPFAGMTNPFATRLDGETKAAEVSATAPQMADVAELTERLVDRILVSSPGDAAQEVRISIADGTLRSTEVSLIRHPDGTLTVTLSTNDAASFQTLVQSRTDLQDRLEQLGEHARVDVENNGAGDDGDPDRRSKGYVGWQTDEA